MNAPPLVFFTRTHETHVTNTSLPAGEYVLSVSASGLGSLRAVHGDGEVAKRQHACPSKAEAGGGGFRVEERGRWYNREQSSQQHRHDQRSYLGAEFPRVDLTHPRSHPRRGGKAGVRRPGREQRQRGANGTPHIEVDRSARGETVRVLLRIREREIAEMENFSFWRIFSRDFAAVHQACQPTRGESYSSHLYEAALQTPKTPTTSKIPTSASVRFADLEEGEESTSDYASIEARSPGDPLADDDWPSGRKGKQYRPMATPSTIRESQFGFCNPNYLGLDETKNHHHHQHHNQQQQQQQQHQQHQQQQQPQDGKYAKLLNSPPDSVLEDEPGRSASQTFAELLELQEIKRVPRAPPKSLPLGSPSRRAVSASRAERQRAKVAAIEESETPSYGPAPLYVFLVGGKEKGQVTVFARPVSLWKLQLAPHIF